MPDSGGSAESSQFLASIAAARKHRMDNISDDVAGEVDKYLADTSSNLSPLHAYPHIKDLYICLNTGLPASAAVERLFSLGGHAFSPVRTRLSAEHFEMMVFLRLAKW